MTTPESAPQAGQTLQQTVHQGTDPWWTTAVGYQVYIRSFADSNGDGVGDLRGITEHLGYLELIGVQVVWITPFYRSPMADAGYDVSDPREVDPAFGTLQDFDELIAQAHARGLKVIVDVVPNHTSEEHHWFREVLPTAAGSPERARYLFRDGAGDGGDAPPNNWASVFGGPAWHRVPGPDGAPGQWYLHIFAPEQPDLDWTNAEVADDLHATLRFWLDRGADGFRIDVAHGMAKPPGLPDAPGDSAAAFDPVQAAAASAAADSAAADHTAAGSDAEPGHGVVPSTADEDPRFDNDGVHEIHRGIRKVVDEYPDALTVGEVWVSDPERFAAYLRPDELHQAFDFSLIESEFTAAALQQAIEKTLSSAASVGASPVWTLSNHDVARPVTRFGGGLRGLQRARALLLLELALPGSVYLYNGEELGLPDVEVPDDRLQDPTWERSGHTERGRDAIRLPMPWEGQEPPFGFSGGSSTWLPSPQEYEPLTVERQLDDPNSTLNLVRTAIELRAEHPAFSGSTVSWYGAPEGCFAFRRDPGGLAGVLNAGEGPVPLPPGEVLLTSIPLVDGLLPVDASALFVASALTD